MTIRPRRRLTAPLHPAILSLLAVLLSAVPRAAGADEGLSALRRGVEKLEALATRGDWKPLAKRADAVLQLVLDKRMFGEESSRLTARALALAAVADDQKGRTDQARWRWSFARALDPALADHPPSVAENGARLFASVDDPDDSLPFWDAVARAPAPLAVTQPETVAWPRHDALPSGAEAIAVDVVVGADGLVRPLRIESGSAMVGAVLSFVRATRTWRFRPARDAGGARRRGWPPGIRPRAVGRALSRSPRARPRGAPRMAVRAGSAA